MESFGGITGLLAASPGGDQPGARIEDHAALVAVVRREHFAQALDGTGRLAVAQGRERRAGALKPSDERERGLEVVSVEDRLMYVLEAQLTEPGVLEDRRGGTGVAERERVRARGTGCSASPSAASISRAHSLHSCRCQTSITRRASGRRAAAMLTNEAIGSEKNIVPKRLIATSKPAGSKGCS